MDKIWDKNPSKSEVIGRCGGDEKTEWPRRTDKSRTLQNKNKNYHCNVLNKIFKYFSIVAFYSLSGIRSVYDVRLTLT